MQAPGGGVITLSSFLGQPDGSSNTEATSIALLPYDDHLVPRMHSLFACVVKGTYP